MLKAILKTHQTMRDLSSTERDTLLIKASSPEADSVQKQTQTHVEKVREEIRLGLPGPDQVSPAEEQQSGHANSTRDFELLGSSGTPSPKPNLRRGSILQSGQADVKRITLNIVSPEKRLLVLEALSQTEVERKYGRAPPTAMERELQTFLEDLLKT